VSSLLSRIFYIWLKIIELFELMPFKEINNFFDGHSPDLEKPDYLTTFGRSKLTTSKLLIF